MQGMSPSGFPIGTMVVNISGCFLIGVLLRQFLNMQVSGELREGSGEWTDKEIAAVEDGVRRKLNNRFNRT